MTVPQVMINEAEEKASEYQLAKSLANQGCAPKNWNNEHPCEFGVFQSRDGLCYAVVPLFLSAIAEFHKDGFSIVYRTDQ